MGASALADRSARPDGCGWHASPGATGGHRGCDSRAGAGRGVAPRRRRGSGRSTLVDRPRARVRGLRGLERFGHRAPPSQGRLRSELGRLRRGRVLQRLRAGRDRGWWRDGVYDRARPERARRRRGPPRTRGSGRRGFERGRRHSRRPGRARWPRRLPRALRRARTGWTEWARALREASGIDIGHRTSGVLRVARTGAESAAAAAEVTWNTTRGLRASLLDAAAAHEVEPELSPDVIAAA